MGTKGDTGSLFWIRTGSRRSRMNGLIEVVDGPVLIEDKGDTEIIVNTL